MFSAQRHDPDRSQKTGPKNDARQSSATAHLTGRDLIVKHLQDLYDSNRGALYSNSLVQAQAAFEQGDFVKTLDLVKASREIYRQRHRKIQEKDPKKPNGKTKASRKERLAIERKQTKIRTVLDSFDEVLAHLEKMARLQCLGRPRPVAESSTSRGARPAAKKLPKTLRDEDDSTDGSKDPIGPQRSYLDCIIDTGSFTQLLTTAQQSGIVPNADQIAHVRDREFRTGKYQMAFSIIERMSVKFIQTAIQRQQKLKTEEIDYRSGVLKMSAKEWLLKKQRDTQQTHQIERARRNFARVLDGLRILTVAR